MPGRAKSPKCATGSASQKLLEALNIVSEYVETELSPTPAPKRDRDNEYEGYPMDGHDLLQYADAVDEAVKKDIADFNGDLMQYYHEDDSVRQKVVSAVPSVEIHGNKLCGCLNVELRESLNEGEQAVLCDYISGQYSDGWGEGFEQRDIRVEDGTLAVHFWQEDDFKNDANF